MGKGGNGKGGGRRRGGGAAQSGGGSTEPRWDCRCTRQCGFKGNYASRQTCFKCGADKNGHKPAPNAPSQRTGGQVHTAQQAEALGFAVAVAAIQECLDIAEERMEEKKEAMSPFAASLWNIFGSSVLYVQIYVGLSYMQDKISPILLTDSRLR